MNMFIGSLRSWMRTGLIVMLASGLNAAMGETIPVFGGRAGIQEAIEIATDGDTIIVRPGVYKEHLNFLGKHIQVRGSEPARPQTVAETIIEGTVAFVGGEGRGCAMNGLTIRNPDAATSIYSVDSSPSITNCTIEYLGHGSAIDADGGGPMFTHCTIELASPELHQKIVRCADSTLTFNDCVIAVERGHVGLGRQTYNLNIMGLVGASMLVEFRPEMRDGAVYVVGGTQTMRMHMGPGRPPTSADGCRTLPPPADPFARADQWWLFPTAPDSSLIYIAPNLRPFRFDACGWGPNPYVVKRQGSLHPTVSDASLPHIAPHLLNRIHR